MCLKHVSAPQTVNFQGRNSHNIGVVYEQEANNGPQQRRVRSVGTGWQMLPKAASVRLLARQMNS